MAEHTPKALPDEVIERLRNVAPAHGDVTRDAVYVRSTEREALPALLGYLPYPTERAGLDDPIFVVEFAGRFWPHYGSPRPMARGGAFIRLIVKGDSFGVIGTNIGDERDLSELGPVTAVAARPAAGEEP
jgi:hypothetical protein